VIQAEQGSAPESLTDRTARAVQWRVIGAVISVLFQFAAGVLLARLLTPADFGVMTLAVIVLGLAQLLGDLGIGDAVVQRAQLTEHHVRTAFTFSVMLGFALAAVMMMAAPLAAIVMGDAHRYFGVRVGALATAGISGGVAFAVRVLLEARGASDAAITLGVLIAAAVPSGIAMLWQLGEPDFEPIRARLPRSCVRLIDARTHRRSTPEKTPTASGSPA
jgi:O-antigen/teichoic acid export membrane protein